MRAAVHGVTFGFLATECVYYQFTRKCDDCSDALTKKTLSGI